uniref:trypsin-like peptidase domain-containing protein n=1 Tax=unclassified Variovorax TaxID=663243 RepID=UPI000D3C08C6
MNRDRLDLPGRLSPHVPAGGRLRRSALPAAVLACAGLLGACAAPPSATVAATPSAAAAASPAPAFSSLVASRGASVVDIRTLRVGRDESAEDIELEIAPERDFADRLAWPLPASARISQIRDLASGLILSADGLILTSAHVVAHIDEAQVQLDDGRRFTARVLGADRRTDVGLLKIEATGLPSAVIGDSAGVAPGDWVAAISAPFGFHGSVTAGVVSAVDRVMGGGGEVGYIQTDVAINPGSSGSPLFNSRGEVVGINSMIYSGNGGYMGLSFAVPINLAMRIARQLQADGRVRRAYLGAEFQALTPALAQSFAVPGAAQARGAVVVRVEDASPARSAGLAQGDVLTAIDGQPIAHYSDLPQRIGAQAPGTAVALELWRGGQKRLLRVRLSEQPAPAARPSAAATATTTTAEWNDGLGLRLGEPSAALRRQMRAQAGLVVRDAAGLARSEGIRAGDLLVALNATPLERVDDFRQALARLAPGRTVALLVMRDGRLSYVAVQLPPLAARADAGGAALR